MACLRKWYFDCLTPETDYVFVYFASVRLAGLVFRTVTVHLARPAKGVVLTRALAIPRRAEDCSSATGHILRMSGGEIRRQADGFALNFSGRDCSLRLNYRETHACQVQPVVIPAGKKGSVLWKPLGLRYRVSGEVSIGGEQIDIPAAAGYVDYLDATCFPRAFPVRNLYWGRLIHPQVALAYLRAQDRTGTRAWSSIFGRAGEVTFESCPIAISELVPDSPSGAAVPARGGYSVSHLNADSHVQVDVRHEVPVQAGGFLDRQEGMSALTRWLLKALTRNPQSTKCLSRADVNIDLRGLRVSQRDLPLIDEYVTF